MKTLALNLLLVVIALVLLILLLPFTPVFVGVELQRKQGRTERIKYLAGFARWVAVALDMLGNVLFAPLLNALCIVRGGYHFGRPGETISSALGKNKQLGTLTTSGLWLATILDKLDPNHVEKSIIHFPITSPLP